MTFSEIRDLTLSQADALIGAFDRLTKLERLQQLHDRRAAAADAKGFKGYMKELEK